MFPPAGSGKKDSQSKSVVPKIEQQHAVKNTTKKIHFLALSPDVVYERCPHFKILLDDMVQLANATLHGAI